MEILLLETVDKFIVWICHKFCIGEPKELIKNFQEETHSFIDSVKQLEYNIKRHDMVFHTYRAFTYIYL